MPVYIALTPNVRDLYIGTSMPTAEAAMGCSRIATIARPAWPCRKFQAQANDSNMTARQKK
jgi:hypothetical protein